MHGELDDESPFATNVRTLASLGIIVIVGAVASSSGVGGGAIFIPLLNALVGFNLKSSTSLSQACITCGAAAALLANLIQHHPSDPRVALVDFTLVAVLTPILLMGVGVGVLLNVMLPAWLLTALLLLLLSLLIAQSVNKGRALWLQETAIHSRLLQQQHLQHQHQHLAHIQREQQRLGEDPALTYQGVNLLANENQRPRQRRRRRLREMFRGGSGRGEVADAATTREPLLLDSADAAALSLSPTARLASSPHCCLTPAPTAVWNLSDFGAAGEGERVGEGPADVRVEEFPAAAAPVRLSLKGDGAAADGREWSRCPSPSGLEACMPGMGIAAASIPLPGLGLEETKSPDSLITQQQIAAVVAAAGATQMAATTAIDAPAGPTYQLRCDTGGGGPGPEPVSAAGSSVRGDIIGDAAAAAALLRTSPPQSLPLSSLPSPSPPPPQPQQLPHHPHQQRELPTLGPHGARGPSAVSKSPFRRQSVPRSANTDDTTGAASSNTTPTPCSAVPPVANGSVEKSDAKGFLTSAPVFHSHMVAAALRQGVVGGSGGGGALAAAQLSPPEAAAVFAEALATALAAVAASSSSSSAGTIGSSSTSWVAAVTSIFALTAPSWRAFNELGLVDDEDEEDVATEVGDIHDGRAREPLSADALLEPPPDSDRSNHPEVSLPDASSRHNTSAVDARSGVVIDRGKPASHPLQSVLVDTEGDTGGSRGSGSGNVTPCEQIDLGRLRGLPGPQLSTWSRRSPHSPSSHVAGCKAPAATGSRKCLGAAGAAAAVAVAAAAAFLERPLVHDGGLEPSGKDRARVGYCGGGGGVGVPGPLSLRLPSLDTPQCREGSRPGVRGSPERLVAVEEGPLLAPYEMVRNGVAATGRSAGPPLECPPAEGLGGTAAVDNASELLEHQHQQEEEAEEEDEERRLLLPRRIPAGARFTTSTGNDVGSAVIKETVGYGGSVEGELLIPITASGHQLRGQGGVYQTGAGHNVFGGLVAALRRIPPAPVMALVVSWGVYFALQFLRSRLVVCSALWWALAMGQAIGMGGLSVGALLVAAAAAAPPRAVSTSTFIRRTTPRLFKSRTPDAVGPTVITSAIFAATSTTTTSAPSPDWQRQQLALLLQAPVAVLGGTCAAGLAGGLLGLGGGMVMGPLLLHLGVQPQVTAATSGAMVLFSSSAALVQFALMGRLNIAYAVVFGAASAAASIVGSQVLSRVVRRSGRPSVVVLALAAVMTVGAACVAASGLRTALEEWQSGDGGAPGGVAALCGRQ